MVETPNGLFTASGFWFRTTFAGIDDFAPGLRSRIDIHNVVRDTETWIRSFESIGLWSFMISILFLSVYPSALIALILSLGWYFLRSAAIHPSVTPFIKPFTMDASVFLATVFVISYVGNSGRTLDAVIGLAFFLIFRFGWLRKILDKWHDSVRPISMNDRLLRMMLLRLAIRHDIPIASVQTMRNDLIEAFQKSSLTRK